MDCGERVALESALAIGTDDLSWHFPLTYQETKMPFSKTGKSFVVFSFALAKPRS